MLVMFCSPFRRLLWLASLLFIATSSASTAFADDRLEEIVVTADLRERSLGEVPASVSVLDAARLEDSAVQHFEELIFAVPNLNWSGDGNRARYLQIRGVGELEQYEGAPNPSVGFLIDDIDFSGIGGIATLYDLERIEVLRGPQGTRYGANALAGLVYATSREPTGETDISAQLSAGGDDLWAAGIAAGGELGGADVRVSLHRHESNGFRNNPFLGRDDTNGREETTARARIQWQTAGGWSLKAAGMLVDLADGYDAFALDNSLTVLSDKPGRDAQQSVGLSFRAERDLASGRRFTAITSAARSDIDFSFDADWGNTESWAPFVYDYVSATARERQTLSQEFRLQGGAEDRLSWTVGVYGLALDEGLTTTNRGTYEDLVVYNFTDSLDESLSSDFDALNLAVFGELSRDITPAGTLTFGMRLEQRDSDYSDSGGLTSDPSETMVGGELAYLHRLGDDSSVYVKLARGYKAGGFNLGAVPDGRREFEQEVLWNLEAGWRTSFADGRASLDAAVFTQRRDDQQVRSSVQLNPNDPASFVFFTDNAARGSGYGLEALLNVAPTESVSLYLSAGLLNTEFDSYRGGDPSLEGREQAHAPSYSLAAGGEYALPSGWFAAVDIMARDAFYFDVSHDQRSKAYERVNLRLGYRADRWDATLWARNLTDENYAVRGFYFGNEPPDFPATLYTRRGDPRQVGVTLNIRFED